MHLETVAYDERFLEPSLGWLTDPETAMLTLTPPLTTQSQRAWFDSLPTRTDYLIWGVVLDGEPVGAFGLKHVTDSDAEYWGYLGVKRLWGAGLGQHLVDDAIRRAGERGLRSVYLRVHRGNARAIRLYERCGFVATGCDDAGVIRMERSIR